MLTTLIYYQKNKIKASKKYLFFLFLCFFFMTKLLKYIYICLSPGKSGRRYQKKQLIRI